MTRLIVVLGFLGVGVLGGPAVARADLIRYSATLSGAAEAPPNASPGTGFTVVTFDTDAHTMRVEATFSGLIGTTTASHIHSATVLPGVGTAGVATQVPSFTGFPLGVTSGTMDTTFDMTLASSYRPGFITASGGTPALAEAALLQGALDGKAYFNIHSTQFPGGEIRGFLAIPEPTSLTILLGVGAIGVIARVRRRMA